MPLPWSAHRFSDSIAADADEWMVFGDEEVRIVLSSELRESTVSDRVRPTSPLCLTYGGRHT